MLAAEQIAATLPCWSGPVAPVRLTGGISNENFLITDGAAKYVVRVNGDVPVHGVWRGNDAGCNRAAALIGIAPPVFYADAKAIVVNHVEGRTFAEDDVRSDANLARILPLIRRTHVEAYRHLRGPVCAFWPFRVCRDYGFFLEEQGGRMASEVDRLRAVNERLEVIVGPIEVVLGHNDLLAGNFIDDGARIWLIDWEHAGLSSPLFDLANLASNNSLSDAQENWLLENYFERPADEELQRRFRAMKCASILREAMWSMVSESTSTLDFDYAAYADQYMARFEAEYEGL
ncbi:MAG: phosphotransferase [Rhodospirillaceae bacterium]|nr:phosphotransferase [Rhodospirillaceae bacterium]MBT5193703.1 phosphotransferase [Rhodospirillaceae bacterium]MBT5894850.1 phosphotransferase [Rhodospirillaceae bacterium]MBT6431416.1 phosphotransferase [Rhodospirillaceae bacterium]MBT7755764.1 phosphotransferase [Rhodospirillaceae bacterium]